VHSLAPALTLTLTLTLTLSLTQTLNYLANKPQQTTSALFGLMYPRTAQRTINIYVLFISGNHVIENDFRSSDRVKEVNANLRPGRGRDPSCMGGTELFCIAPPIQKESGNRAGFCSSELLFIYFNVLHRLTARLKNL